MWRRSDLIVALAASAALATTWIVAQPALHASGAAVPTARLRLSAAYLVLAPYCDVLDALTLLSVRQHAALLLTCLAAYGLWRSVRHGGVEMRGRRRLVRECTRLSAFMAVIAGVYTLGALEPRPMAALQLRDPRLLAVDVHSHTDASWDGRRGFTEEDNRAWHRAAGFTASYVSDHASVAAATAGMAHNPRLAGDGTVILPAVEFRCEGEHLVLLGAGPNDTAADCDLHQVRLTTSASVGVAPVAVLTIPGNVVNRGQLPGVRALEIADGAPRALDQMQRDGRALQHLADSASFVRVAGSNNHGWGRTAAAWTVMSIDGWKSMTPDSLDVAIRATLLRHPEAVLVVERRRRAPGASLLELSATAPLVVWTLLTTLSPLERLSWICWIWLGWTFAAIRRANRRAATRFATRQGERRAA